MQAEFINQTLWQLNASIVLYFFIICRGWWIIYLLVMWCRQVSFCFTGFVVGNKGQARFLKKIQMPRKERETNMHEAPHCIRLKLTNCLFFIFQFPLISWLSWGRILGSLLSWRWKCSSISLGFAGESWREKTFPYHLQRSASHISYCLSVSLFH